jgi:hypothetical protein
MRHEDTAVRIAVSQWSQAKSNTDPAAPAGGLSNPAMYASPTSSYHRGTFVEVCVSILAIVAIRASL